MSSHFKLHLIDHQLAQIHLSQCTGARIKKGYYWQGKDKKVIKAAEK